jgi:O-antigen/teichoic acid export membrane protein
VQRGDVEATGQMVALPVSAAITIVGVALGWGLWALFLGNVGAFAVAAGWNAAGARRVVPGLRLRLVMLERPAAKAYLAFSGLALLSQISDVVDSQWDKVVLSHFVGSKAVASFQIGTTLVLQGKALALLPLAPLLVAVAELRNQDRARMRTLFDLMARAGMAVAAVVLGAIFVFAPAFLRLWLGPGQASSQAAVAARLFTFAVALNLLCAPLALRAFGEGWYRLASASAAVNMVVNGGVSLALTVAIGFNGALYGSIVGNLAGCVLMIGLMRRRLGDEWTPIPCRALVIGVAMAALGLASGLGHVSRWSTLVAAGGAYALLAGLACARAERLRLTALTSRRMST